MYKLLRFIAAHTAGNIAKLVLVSFWSPMWEEVEGEACGNGSDMCVSLPARSSPASQLSVPQAEIKVPALADPPSLRHSLAPAAAEQEQPQHALLRSGNEAERFMGWMCH